MPPGQPGLLTRKEYGALAAYILSSNGQKAPGRIAIGSESAEPAQLAAEKPNASTGDRPNLFGIETPEALAASAAIVKMALVQNQSLARYTPVTENMLSAPPPEDWLSWRRTRNGHGYSPLGPDRKRPEQLSVGKESGTTWND